MKKDIRLKILSLFLVLFIALSWLPSGNSLAAGGSAPPYIPMINSNVDGGSAPPDMQGNNSNGGGDGEDEGFVPGEVLAPADSWEHARSVAQAYGLQLKSYAYGIAVMLAPDAKQAAVSSNLTRRGGLPKLSLNWIYHTDAATNAINRRADTYAQTAMSYDPYKFVAQTRTTSRQAIFTGDGEPDMPGAEEPDKPEEPDKLEDPDKRGAEEHDKPGVDEPDKPPFFKAQWHHAEIDTERAHELSTGAGVLVAVIDTGIDIDHPAFAGRLSEKAYNSHTDQAGLEFVRDGHGHGTHVGGIVAAAPDVGVGVTGVAPGAKLLVINGYNPAIYGFESASLYRGIKYAADNGAGVINMSLGRSYYYGPDELEHAVIAGAVARGATVVCAAGNKGFLSFFPNDHASYPAAYPECIAVSATKPGFTFDKAYSNYGPEIAVSAPGTDIISAAVGGGYSLNSGTSMASPVAAGICALIAELNPEFTPQQIRDALCSAARDAGEVGWDELYGAGIANAYASLLGPDRLCSVTYDYNDGVRSPVTIKVVPGGALLETFAPLRDGYSFDGWLVRGTDKEFYYGDTVSEDMDVYANWVETQNGMYILEFPDFSFRWKILRTINGLDGGRRTDSGIVADDRELFALINHLDITGMGIYDVTGLEYLSKLESLSCSNNHFSKLDVSHCHALTFLDCSINQLTGLDLSKNAALKHLSCFFNQLTSLDLPENSVVVDLICAINELVELDLTGCANLMYLNCGGNKLTELDVSNNTSLEILWCYENILNSLELTNNPELNILFCGGNSLKELDVSKNVGLTMLDCMGNRLSSLDTSANPRLWSLNCKNNLLTGLDLSGNFELIEIFCENNRLSRLDITKCASLNEVYCSNNRLTALDLSENTSLYAIICDHNCLSNLDITKNTSMKILDCAFNYMASIDSVIGWSSNPDLIPEWTFYFHPQLTGDPPTGKDITDSFVDHGFLAAVRDIINTPDGRILDYDVVNIQNLY